MKERASGMSAVSPPSAAKPTRRVPGRWGELTVTGNDLVPEVSVALPWLSAEDFERAVHQATDGLGFSFEADLQRRPDVVLGERDVGLDTVETRRRLLLGIGLGAVGLLLIAVGVGVLLPSSGSLGLILLAEMGGAVAAATGLTLATQSRWESDLLRVRLDPATTRVLEASTKPFGKPAGLSVRVFLGRVTSSSTSSRSGTFRSLLKVLPSSNLSAEAAAIAARLTEVARNLAPNSVRGTPLTTTPASLSRRSSHLAPLVSKSGRPEWFDYPRWLVWLRVTTLIVPMILLMFGPFLMFMPWNYQRVDFTPTGPSTQALAAEPWSPTGGTSGELWWYTYNPVTSADVNNVPVVVALCPIDTLAIDPSVCRSVVAGSFTALTNGDTSISIPEGWHVVANVTVSEICSGCHTSIRFSAPAMAIGLGLTLAGVAVLVPSVVIWLKLRARVKSAWPE